LKILFKRISLVPLKSHLMNVHEYQAKDILKQYDVPVQDGRVADSPEKAVEMAKKVKEDTNTALFVIKAQIHAGGRGKGKIIGSEQRGVAIAKDLDEVKTIAKNLWVTFWSLIKQVLPEKQFIKSTLRRMLIIPDHRSIKNFILEYY